MDVEILVILINAWLWASSDADVMSFVLLDSRFVWSLMHRYVAKRDLDLAAILSKYRRRLALVPRDMELDPLGHPLSFDARFIPQFNGLIKSDKPSVYSALPPWLLLRFDRPRFKFVAKRTLIRRESNVEGDVVPVYSTKIRMNKPIAIEDGAIPTSVRCVKSRGRINNVTNVLQHVPQLTELHLGGSTFSSSHDVEDCRALAAALKKTPRLTTLVLSWKQIGEDGCRALAASWKDVPLLTTLTLYWCCIRHGCVELAASLKHLPRLTALELMDCSIGSRGSHALAASLKHVPRLMKLSVSGNWIKDDGCRVLAASLKNVPKLTSLGLSHNDIGVDGCRALAEMALPHLLQLKILWIDKQSEDSALGYRGKEALAPFKDRMKIL